MESDVLCVSTAENAATCCMLDILDLGESCSGFGSRSTRPLSPRAHFHFDVGFEEFPQSPSRPYSGAYLSHVLVLSSAEKEGHGMRDDKVRWASYLMEECMRSLYSSTTINLTTEQELLLRGSDIPSLDETLKQACDERIMQDGRVFSEVVLPCESTPCLPRDSAGANFQSKRHGGCSRSRSAPSKRRDRTYILARSFVGYEFSSDSAFRFTAYARERPLDHAALLAIIDYLDKLGAIEQAALDQIDHARPPVASKLFPPPRIEGSGAGMTANPEFHAYLCDLISHLFCMGSSALVLELHTELQRRAQVNSPPTMSSADVRGTEREKLLRKQVAEMVVAAARLVGRGVERLPCLSHITHFRCIRIGKFNVISLRPEYIFG